MENNLENLTIGVFAKAAGVNVETIRFYQRKGLLREPDKPYGSIRRYGEADVVRVKFVKSAQRLGFSLDEIAELLRLDDGTHCEEASSLAEHKLKDGHCCKVSDEAAFCLIQRPYISKTLLT
ncbi:MerR family transcriptional regulator, partial [Escherichia coli]|uniref:MerR family transcriptional regulator n=1 Tax=Escherichia coli TaxID=562 RepID=UPI003F8BA293